MIPNQIYLFFSVALELNTTQNQSILAFAGRVGQHVCNMCVCNSCHGGVRSEMRSDPQKRVTVFGVGRLGICFALKCESAGYNVLGVDVVPSYVQALNDKSFASDEPNVSAFLQKSTNFRATLSLDEGLAHSDLLFLLLATPTGIGEKSYDHSMLSKLLQQIVCLYSL
jgi:hypothetical protein